MTSTAWGLFGLAALLAWAASTDAAADTWDEITDMTTDLQNSLNHPNVRAFLATIRAGEGTADAGGYNRLFGGNRFDSFADHPRLYITRTMGGKPITSSAAGAYQFLARTWDECAAALDLTDFAPPSQDLAAVYLIRRRGALGDVIAGRFGDAVRKCAREWASLPGSPYGQPTKTLAQAQQTYQRAGGTYA